MTAKRQLMPGKLLPLFAAAQAAEKAAEEVEHARRGRILHGGPFSPLEKLAHSLTQAAEDAAALSALLDAGATLPAHQKRARTAAATLAAETASALEIVHQLRKEKRR